MDGWRRDGGMVKVADLGILGIEPRSPTWDMAGMVLGLRSSSWRGRPKAQHGAQADVSERMLCSAFHLDCSRPAGRQDE
jgi:hypothetical protein